MLGQPVSMLIPEVVGFKLHGKLPAGATATDLVLTVTEMLRKKKVVGKFVEFYGTGLSLAAARRSRDDRQHGAGVRRDDGLLPRRRRDAQVPAPERARRAARRARRGVHEGAGTLPHRRDARSGLHRHARARPRAPSSRASPARSVRRIAFRCTSAKQMYLDALEADLDKAGTLGGGAPDEARRPQRPATPELSQGRHGRTSDGATGARETPACTVRVQRPDVHAAARRGRHRRDHELHEHVESVGDARRRDCSRGTR